MGDVDLPDLVAPATATAVGSLPLLRPTEAATFALEHQPELPAAPQLPMRAPGEGMLAQVARTIPGVDIYPSGNLRVDPCAVVETARTGTAVEAQLTEDAWSGALAFADAVASRPGPVKVQLAGPVTLGLALADAGVDAGPALAVASSAVSAYGAALLRLFAERAPHAPVVVFLDEPSLVARREPGLPVRAGAVVDVLSEVLASLRGAAATGIHCCGSADWKLVVMAGPDVVSLPCAQAAPAADVLAGFLDHGGWVAWGAVPTDGPVSDDPDRLWRRFAGCLCEAASLGCDPARLRLQSLVTPDCGLAGHGRSQAARVLGLVEALSERLRDQAAVTRITVGT